MDELIKAVKALVSDIAAMAPSTKSHLFGWFGPFSDYEIDHGGDESASIEWPNLAISLNTVKHQLEQLEPTKSDIVKEVAASKGLRVIDVTFEEANLEDLRGLPRIQTDV